MSKKFDKTDRYKIIIEEINYWKTHKLLPETYCDYLLALYTSGEEERIINNPSFIHKLITGAQIFLCMMLLPFSFLVIYFTKFNFILQLAILILFIIYSFWSYRYFKKRGNRLYSLALLILLFIILLFVIFIVNVIFEHRIITLMIILLNFIFWYYIGKKNNLTYLTVASILGIVFSVFYTFL